MSESHNSRTELEQKLLMLDVGFNESILAQLPDRALEQVITAVDMLRAKVIHPTDKRTVHAMMKAYEMPSCPICHKRLIPRTKRADN